MRALTAVAAAALLALPGAALAQDAARPAVKLYGLHLEGYPYPFPLERHAFTSQHESVTMSFMDVAPRGPANGRTVVLLHGKNFCAATWKRTIEVLAGAGYRVIAPDQIGFCASSKPEDYQYSFQQLATNTMELLRQRGVDKVTVVGHSMGGMLAARFALMFPAMTETLVMVNPLGLEDWQAAGVPYGTIEQAYQAELKTSYDTIRAYQNKFYYNGQWTPDYDPPVLMLAGLYAGPGKELVARAGAKTSDMIFTQPVVHEFPNIRVPTVLMIGQLDRTAPGANRAPPDVAEKLGDYPALGRKAKAAIPGATLIEFDGLGHAPQTEDPARFHEALLNALGR
ncbi:alpha/beta fold hydrolase [Rhodoplanes roseus]|uniref:Alpha/beta hydrolase n=1 Tax=Rhodoplanes roseus TaxID=29409 RepID=A0A327KLH5_9BRAD|nr:alpha/beta hydrolase [Rhodoplanes roseus]RAI39357.1 alpha/beta hydrolase [Rhodoplanes roseus]